MTLTHRPVAEQDLAAICAFTQSAAELFYCFPKADFQQVDAAFDGDQVELFDLAVLSMQKQLRQIHGGVPLGLSCTKIGVNLTLV